VELLLPLRDLASDRRWRVREAVAMALQRWGAVDMHGLVCEMWIWCRGNHLEQRAAAAALCEPRLLGEPEHVQEVLKILDAITASIGSITDRHDESFLALRKGLGYCWSVAVVALPGEGKPLMEKWLESLDKDIRWIMQENLKKTRLKRLDPLWVGRWQNR